jgi:hypothetical protein
MMAKHAAGAAQIKAYVVDNLPTHAPIHQFDYSIPVSPSGDALPLPAEVAIVMSYRSDEAPGIALGRTRGRIYLGPLNVFASTPDGTTGPARPSTTFRDQIIAGAINIKDRFATAGGAWVIVSPTMLASLAPNYYFNVTRVSVDDAFDTQRRRGAQPTFRTVHEFV